MARDDVDFNANELIDRNEKVAEMFIREAAEPVEMKQDPFDAIGVIIPEDLPYLRHQANDYYLLPMKHHDVEKI